MEGGDEIYVETDPFLPDDGAEPLARLSRRLEPPSPAGPFERFLPSRLDAGLAVALAERLQPAGAEPGGPDGAVPIDHSLAPVGGTSPAAGDPALASLDSRTTAEEAVPVEVAAVEPAAPEPVIAMASVHPTAEEDSGAPMPVLGSRDLDRRRKAQLAGAPGYDDGVARPLRLAEGEQEKALGCLATAIYFEARGESETGQVAVGQVIVNRLRSPFYPKSICEVVYQGSGKRRWGGCQFSFACDGIADRITEPGPWREAMTVARRVMAAEAWLSEVGNATHYHADYVSPRWRRDMVEKDRIGKHIFYRVRWWG
jgi:spore germination cell wall hydrolase CwlJ-like protein